MRSVEFHCLLTTSICDTYSFPCSSLQQRSTIAKDATARIVLSDCLRRPSLPPYLRSDRFHISIHSERAQINKFLLPQELPRVVRPGGSCRAGIYSQVKMWFAVGPIATPSCHREHSERALPTLVRLGQGAFLTIRATTRALPL